MKVKIVNCIWNRKNYWRSWALAHGNEFADYEDGSADFYKYYMQECEIDAREYAEAGVKEYLRRIREYYDEEWCSTVDDA